MSCKHLLLVIPILLTINTKAQIDTAGLIAHWTFDSTKADVTGNGHDMVTGYKYHSGTPPAVYTNGINGEPNTALQFRSHTKTSAGYQKDLIIDSTYSISAVLKFDTLTPAYILVINEAYQIAPYDHTYGMGLSYLSNTPGKYFIPINLHLEPNNYTNHVNAAYFDSTKNEEWYFIVVTYDNKHFKTYVNGSLKSVVYSPGIQFETNISGPSIGYHYDLWYRYYGPSFIGSMDDLRIYNRALSDSEIKTYPFEFLDTTVVWNMTGADSVICSGDKFIAKYLVSKLFKSNNTFTVQLSDTNGSFNTPINIGSANGNSSGTISCTIPTSVNSGKYLARIISTSPVDTSLEFYFNYHPVNNMNADIDVEIIKNISNTNPPGQFCMGDSVLFDQIGMKGFGTPPIPYQWFLNNDSTPVSTNSYYSSDSLNNRDSIFCVIGSTHQCWYGMKDTSVYVANVNPVDTPKVTISILPGNELCLDDSATFYVSFKDNLGSPNRFYWKKNSTSYYVPLYPDTFKTNAFDHLDTIYCQTASNATCALGGFFSSNKIVVELDSTFKDPQAVITASPSANVAAGTDITFTATLTDTGSNPTLQWIVNGQPHIGTNTSTLQVPYGFLLSGNTVSLRIENTTSKCILKSNVDTSNQIRVTYFSNVSGITVNSDLNLYPNPNKGSFTIAGSIPDGNYQLSVLNVLGQVVHKENIAISKKSIRKNLRLGASVQPGIYQLQLLSENNIYTLQLLVEK